MNNIEVEINTVNGENVYKTVLENGLKVFIVKRPGYVKKMGMFGTVFGSIDNNFIDIQTGESTKVTDGIAHFLEHKLFEQENSNALDVFSRMGVDSNAYTSFDHTVYFFETVHSYNECLSKLIDFVSSPYFTDENVEKEKGIIEQEIKMYEDEPNALVYYNLMRCMYAQNPINIDIAGTVESISKIDKEVLYQCYNTFYNLKNMFLILIGDIDIEYTLQYAEKEIAARYAGKRNAEIIRNKEQEQKAVAKKEEQKQLSIYMPVVCMGIKMERQTGKENIKNKVIANLINNICFSNTSSFYKKLYENGIIISEPDFAYESGEDFAHITISSYTTDVERYVSEVKKHLIHLKDNEIDEEQYQIMLKKEKGETIYDMEKTSWYYRSIIDSVIQKVDVFEELKVLDNICKKDVEDFLKNNVDLDRLCVSKVVPLDKQQ